MSIFKEPIVAGVATQIEKRQTAVKTRNTDTIKWLQSRQAWVKMTSAVNINNSSGPATNYILSSNLPSSRYSLTSPGGGSHKLGRRPIPGITSVEVKTKGAYGSLREAVVQFKCWDIEQLSDLEKLYMRPGYTVLVEWGWLPFLNNSGKLATTNPNMSKINLITPSPSNKDDIIKQIIASSQTDGNYDAVYGYVKNYNWSLRDDGGYDCSTTIITINEVVESLKINQGGFTDTTATNLTGKLGTSYAKGDFLDKAYSQNILAGIMAEIQKAVVDIENPDWWKGGIFTNLGTDVTKLGTYLGYNVLVVELDINNPSGIQNDDSPFSEGFQSYILLYDLVNILNTHVILQDENANVPYTELTLREGNHQSNPGSPLYCSADPYQLSIDPLVCQINNNFWVTSPPVPSSGGLTKIQKIMNVASPYPYVISSGGNFPPYEAAEIGNIFVHTGYVYGLITSMDVAGEDEKEKNDISLLDFLKKLMNGINTAIGNVANFEVFADPVDSKIRIIDASYVAPTTPPAPTVTIQILNDSSVVRKYTFESKIFPEQSTIVAIGAQTEGGALASDTNTLVEFNKGLSDRVIPRKKEPNQPAQNTAKTNNYKSFENIVQFFQDLTPSWFFEQTGEYDVANASKYCNSLKDVIKYRRANSSTNVVNAKKKDIIPTTLNIDIDGIGGIIIGNMFDINQDILPAAYRNTEVGYVITGVSHTIQDNDWVTSLQTQFVNK
jgi:hypothetical protein